MKFSEKWLREFTDPKVDSETLIHQLTMAGLEVDGIQPAYESFNGLVIAEIKSVKKHPDAKKLHICEVDCGDDDLYTVICGAQNVRQGLLTIMAKVGASLPGKKKLEAVTLKGVESNGMLCSAAEIGLGDDHEGIIELADCWTVGTLLEDIIDSEDKIIEVSLTPNRGDCLSLLGIAREVATINEVDLKYSEPEKAKIETDTCRQVVISEKKACSRYVGRVIEGVNARVKTPFWMSEKLRCSGIRSINIIVDITNFVMLELGQPMHAFDNGNLQGEINVRFSNGNETIKLLDETEYEVNEGTLLISDDNGPLAMAGIMGGFNSAVSDSTDNIFLESAFFRPESIAGQSRQYGLHTDSSHRFERGVDPQLQEIAIEKASQLVLELCGGQAGPIVEVKSDEHLPVNKQVNLRKSQIKRVLGIEFDDQFVTQTFLKLGMECNYKNNQWLITPPSHRFDIKIEVDLIEELARIHAYDELPVEAVSTRLKPHKGTQENEAIQAIKEILINRDYQEVITYSFVDPCLTKLLKNKDKTMDLANPIAPELSEMRTSLWPGLITTLQYNVKRQKDRVRLFETGLVFKGIEDLEQNYQVGGLIYGNIHNKQWDSKETLCDFYDIKGDLEAIIYSLIDRKSLEIKPVEMDTLHPGQSMQMSINGEIIGTVGQLHPSITHQLGFDNEVYLFEINIKNINFRDVERYQSISKFPSTKRDISIILDDKIPYTDIESGVKKCATELLSNLELFDVYRGEGIEKGKKSLALGLTFQATSSTLMDEEVDAIMEKIIDGLHNNFGAKLRE